MSLHDRMLGIVSIDTTEKQVDLNKYVAIISDVQAIVVDPMVMLSIEEVDAIFGNKTDCYGNPLDQIVIDRKRAIVERKENRRRRYERMMNR